MSIIRTKLTTNNYKQVKKIFKESFPTHKWSDNIPFPIKDELYLYVVEDKRIVGFCMVHDEPPHATSEENKGSYMYNLCILKSHRNKGIATSLLKKLVEDHPKCYLHMPEDHHLLGWITRHEWQCIGPSLHEMIEYSYGINITSNNGSIKSNDHYDADENIIYL